MNTALAGGERECAAAAEERELDGPCGEECAGDAESGDDKVLLEGRLVIRLMIWTKW
jgi:hypothetical protein